METFQIESFVDEFNAQLAPLSFGPPVSTVYNPLSYARESFITYWKRYGLPPKRVVFLGMNPGPWGMAQTGIPFGDVQMVKNWMEINVPVRQPTRMHPKRPVEGFSCPRGEVSGQRFWGWAKDRFGSPSAFFKDFWVANYCPLVFMESTGRNLTPDRLPEPERRLLLAVCDQALQKMMRWLAPVQVIGIGAFAAKRAGEALKGMTVQIGRITHPSPANPKANRGWQLCVEGELERLGIL